MEHKKDQHQKDHAAKGSCSTGGAPKTSGSCGTESKKTEHTGCCSKDDKSKKGSCG